MTLAIFAAPLVRFRPVPAFRFVSANLRGRKRRGIGKFYTLLYCKKKRLHPHSMRHSTAIYLLKSGVDLSTISHWLGHSSVNTTNKYVAIDLEMKRKAIEKAKPLDCEINIEASWRKEPDILRWLESL